jgi:hypothetical protein
MFSHADKIRLSFDASLDLLTQAIVTAGTDRLAGLDGGALSQLHSVEEGNCSISRGE